MAFRQFTACKDFIHPTLTEHAQVTDFIHFWAGSSWLNTVSVQQKSRVKILGRCQSVKCLPVKHEDPSTVLQLCKTHCVVKCMLLQL